MHCPVLCFILLLELWDALSALFLGVALSCPVLCIAVMSLCQGLIMLSKRHCLLGVYNCVSGNRVAPSGHRCVKLETVVGALWLTAATGGVRKPELSFFLFFVLFTNCLIYH